MSVSARSHDCSATLAVIFCYRFDDDADDAANDADDVDGDDDSFGCAILNPTPWTPKP